MLYLQIMTCTIAGYEVFLRKRIGRGAIGNVYKAKDKDGTIIAAKEVDNSRSERSAVRELENAQKQSKLNHSNIVKIFHICNEEDGIWVFMEYLGGRDLKHYAREHNSELQKNRLELMIQICEGLNFLHQSKIAHRDVKPENILLEPIAEDRPIVVKLTDFGLAKFHDPQDTTSTMHTKLGTENYMAPEFWIKTKDGKRRYNKSVDIFALGLTFQAILKAEQGDNLKPVAEGCTPVESTQYIGSMMYMRHVYKQPELDVVLYDQSDSTETKYLKEIIRQATWFKPENRPTSSVILEMLLSIHPQHLLDRLYNLEDASEGNVSNEMLAPRNEPIRNNSVKSTRHGNVRSAPYPTDLHSKQGQSQHQAYGGTPRQQVKYFLFSVLIYPSITPVACLH